MDKFLKINSVQGGDFTSSQNLVDFVIPSSMGVVNLKDSYLNLNTKINVTETDTTGGEGIYSVGLRWKMDGAGPHTYPKFVNAALVKNCHVRSDQRGQIENLRRCDQYRQLVSTYDRSERETACNSYIDATQYINPVNKNRFPIFREINKTGGLKSRNLDIAPIQISLADLFGFCDAAPECDLSKLGTLRFHFELNRDRMESVVRMVDPATEWASQNLKLMEDITADGDANEVTTKTKFTNLDLSPFWVGQALEISATHTDGGGSNIANKRVVIDNITWDKDNGGVLKISFTESWGNLAVGKTYTDISLIPYYKDASTPTTINVATSVEVNFAELVIKRVGNPVGLDEIRFDTFSTEETNGLGLTSFQNQYQIEPDAKNVLIAFPTDNSDLISVNRQISSFRLRLNNLDMTDRPIVYESPLYYDRLNMTLGNMGTRLKLLSENMGQDTSDWGSVYDNIETQTTVIANPLFQSEREKYLQVNIDAVGAGVKKLTIFKQLPRVIEV